MFYGFNHYNIITMFIFIAAAAAIPRSRLLMTCRTHTRVAFEIISWCAAVPFRQSRTSVALSQWSYCQLYISCTEVIVTRASCCFFLNYFLLSVSVVLTITMSYACVPDSVKCLDGIDYQVVKVSAF